MTQAVNKSPERHGVMIVTGEASGDLHGSRLIKALRTLRTDIDFCGVGGRLMEAEGCEILFRGEDLAVVGLVEVVRHFKPIYSAFKKLEAILGSEEKPDVLVLIDFPEFNLRLAAKAKKAGVPVLYYVSPQVWAWRRGRVHKIAQVVDRLAAVFPFEPELYRGLDIDVQYVGHPLVTDFYVATSRETFLRQYGLDPSRKVVGLFPGSRRSEIRYCLDTLLKAAELVMHKSPDVQFLLPIAPSLSADLLRTHVATSGVEVTLVDSSIYDIAAACDAIATVSGTVTLQIALTATPMAIIYKLNPITYIIGKRLIKVPYVGLPNIVAGKKIVREFIQNDASPDAICKEILRLLTEEAYAAQARKDLAEVGLLLGRPGCSERVANMVAEMIEPVRKEAV